jgi:hypothetical protein
VTNSSRDAGLTEAAARCDEIGRDWAESGNDLKAYAADYLAKCIRDLRGHPPSDNVMSDHDLLLTIQKLLDGTEWSTEHLNDIARLLTDNGYRVRDLEE